MSQPAKTEWVRSSTDPVTNFSFIGSIDLTRDLGAILKGILPGSALPIFLHEAMHHWCFTSYVGSALAILQLRARSAAYKLEQISSGCYRAVLQIKLPNQKVRDLLQPYDERVLIRGVAANLLRYEAARFALAPVMEGIALMSEFDTSSNEASDTITMPLWWAQQFAVGDVPTTIKSRAFLVELTSARLAPAYVRRKLDLLSQSIRSSQGAYLPGYLCLRRIWTESAHADGRFKDPEVFLTYLSHIVFGDLELTRILLDPMVPIYQVAAKVVQRVHHRLAQIPVDLENKWSRLTAERKRHSDLRLNGASVTSVHDQVLKEMNAPLEVTSVDALRFNTRDEAIRGSVIFDAALTELSNVSDLAVDDTIVSSNIMALEGRELLRIGSAPADLECDGTYISIYGEHGVQYKLSALAGTASFERRSGNVELVISMARVFRALLVFVDKNVVGASYWGRISAEQANALLRVTRLQEDVAQLEAGMREWTTRVVQDLELEATMTRLRRRISLVADRAYRHLSLSCHVRAAEWTHMENAGLFEFLDYDEDLLEAIAVVGLGCSVRLTSASIRQLLNARFGDADTTLTRLAASLSPLKLGCSLIDNESPTCDI